MNNTAIFSFQNIIGEGAFGRVMLANVNSKALKLQDSVMEASQDEKLHVAVKMLKDGHSEEELVNLVKEMEIMKVRLNDNSNIGKLIYFFL